MVKTPYHEEQLTDGLIYAKYHPHIHSFTFSNMTKETVDAAYQYITTLDKEYAEKGIHIQYLYILDDVPYTPYMLTKIKQSLALVSTTLRHSSAVVADTFFARVLQAIIVPNIAKDIMQEVRFFTTESEAFEWLTSRQKNSDE